MCNCIGIVICFYRIQRSQPNFCRKLLQSQKCDTVAGMLNFNRNAWKFVSAVIGVFKFVGCNVAKQILQTWYCLYLIMNYSATELRLRILYSKWGKQCGGRAYDWRRWPSVKSSKEKRWALNFSLYTFCLCQGKVQGSKLEGFRESAVPRF